jgi:hypothetical protein
MHPKLKLAFSQAEESRKMLLESLSSVPEEKFTQPVHGKWSPSQIISHLILSEWLSLQYMKKKSLGIKHTHNTGLFDDLKFALLKLSQRLPLKYKAPKVLSAEGSPATLPLSKLEQQWNILRDDLAAFLEPFDENTIRKKIYKHPVAGRLNVVQAVEFIQAHFLHHLPQIRKRIQ